MKNLLFAAVAAVIFAAGVQAQPSSSAAEQSVAKQHSMTGCLEKGPNNSYILNDVEGNGPKTVGIVSSTADLAPHVGHKIEVTGTPVPEKEAQADTTVKAQHYMRLTAVKMISTSCK